MSDPTNNSETVKPGDAAGAQRPVLPEGLETLSDRLARKDANAAAAVAKSDANMTALSNVPVEIQVVLGTARMSIGNILNLGRGAVVEIDRKVGEQVDIQINHRPVARGEIIIVDEDRLGVTLTEIINIQAGLQ